MHLYVFFNSSQGLLNTENFEKKFTGNASCMASMIVGYKSAYNNVQVRHDEEILFYRN